MSGGRGVVVVFAKAPEPGRVKTRMVPVLSPDQAAEFYSNLLDDVLAATADFAARLGIDPVLTVDPASACGELARRAPRVFRVVPQCGPGLGARMSWACHEAAAGGAAPILLRGSDSPALGLEVVRAALEALVDCDVVISPDRDGGYSLIGLRKPSPELFDHPMSTGRVLEDTLSNARALGLRAVLLKPSFDLDTPGDLELLAQVRAEGGDLHCPRTLAFLDDEGLWPRG